MKREEIIKLIWERCRDHAAAMKLGDEHAAQHATLYLELRRILDKACTESEKLAMFKDYKLEAKS